MRSGGVNARAVSTTCWTSVFPPARCRTFAFRDFMRVPSPAARITIVTFGILFYYVRLFAISGALPPSFLGQPYYDRRGGRRIVTDLIDGTRQVPRHHPQPHFH